jgi:hypothetical protein
MQLARIPDQRPSQVILSKYDQPPPVTTYAAAIRSHDISSRSRVQPSTNKSGSMVVSRRDRMAGLKYFYSYGATISQAPTVPVPGAGGVRSSIAQQKLVQLDGWTRNDKWYIAFPRNLGYVTRVGQLKTNITGGSTDATMQQRPIFPRVQQVRRWSVTPLTYRTRSSRG